MYELASSDEFTIVSITHDIEEVLQSDDCVVMNNGKLFMHDTPENVFKHPDELRKIKLDIPFVLKVKETFKKQKINLKGTSFKEMAEELWRLSSKN
jgi:ABC-type cobalt transport system, ATPase component